MTQRVITSAAPLEVGAFWCSAAHCFGVWFLLTTLTAAAAGCFVQHRVTEIMLRKIIWTKWLKCH